MALVFHNAGDRKKVKGRKTKLVGVDDYGKGGRLTRKQKTPNQLALDNFDNILRKYGVTEKQRYIFKEEAETLEQLKNLNPEILAISMQYLDRVGQNITPYNFTNDILQQYFDRLFGYEVTRTPEIIARTKADILRYCNFIIQMREERRQGV